MNTKSKMGMTESFFTHDPYPREDWKKQKNEICIRNNIG